MQQRRAGVAWWFVIPLMALLAGLFALLLLERRRRVHQQGPAVSPPAPRIALPPEEDAPPPADDLTVIRGIGPKTASVLVQAGIRTFDQLAQSSPEVLRDLLSQSGLRLPNATPEDWIAQAQARLEGKAAP